MRLSRRSFFATAAAVSMTPALPAAPAFAKAPLAGKQATASYRSKIGDFEVTAIHDGFATRPVEGFIRNAELADVQKALSDAFLPTDKAFLFFTTVVVNTGSKLILIDTGIGEFGPPTSGTWMANFKAAGFDPKDVDTVIFSHFHGDHINGLRGKDGVAVFPNAEIMVPAPEWAFWMDDAKMAAAPDAMKGAFQGVRRVFGPVAKDVKQFEWGKEISPGVTSVAAPGHTPGHTAFVVASGAGKMLVMSDTTNHPALFVRNPDWSAVFDMDSAVAVQTRRKLLDMAVADKMQTAFYHAPFPATGYVAKDGPGFRFVPVAWSNAV